MGVFVLRSERRSAVVSSVVSALIWAVGHAAPAGAEEPLDTGFDWSADIPEITVVDLELDAPRPCVVTYKGTGRIAKASASSFVTENVAISAKSTCSTQRLIVSVAIRDEIAGGLQPTHTTSSLGGGAGSSSAATSQTVDYFGRAASQVTFRYEVKASTVRACWEHRFTVVGGVQAIDNGTAACV